MPAIRMRMIPAIPIITQMNASIALPPGLCEQQFPLIDHSRTGRAVQPAPKIKETCNRTAISPQRSSQVYILEDPDYMDDTII